MSYVKKIWKDYPDSTTALNAAGLNNWDTRISNEFTNVNNLIYPKDIAANTDLNTIMDDGYYGCVTSTDAVTLLNCPVKVAFEMEVRRFRASDSYVWLLKHQIIRSYAGDMSFIRILSCNASGVWTFAPWHTYTSSPYGNVFYGTCSTAAATNAKVVSATDFFLVTGVEITVKWTVTNTASSPTLNVNGTGAKPIFYHGSAIPSNYLIANRVYKLSYDGTEWNIIGDIVV